MPLGEINEDHRQWWQERGSHVRFNGFINSINAVCWKESQFYSIGHVPGNRDKLGESVIWE